MRKSALPLLFLAFALPAIAQNLHTFTLSPVSNGAAQFTLIDGNTPNCGNGYCGGVNVPSGEYSFWGLQAPNGPNENPDGTFCTIGSTEICSWGYPNNGFNPNNTVTPKEGAHVYQQPGCGPQIEGCTSYTFTSIPLIGYGAGVTLNLTLNYQWHFHAYRTPCRGCDGNGDSDDGYWIDQSTGGSGNSTYVPQ